MSRVAAARVRLAVLVVVAVLGAACTQRQVVSLSPVTGQARVLGAQEQAPDSQTDQAATPDTAIVPPPADAFTGVEAPRRVTRPIAVTAPRKAGGVWAVIIGIDDYPGNDHDLRAAVADARDVDQALAGYGVPGDRRLLLVNGQATLPSVQAAIAWLVDNAGPDATAVFFFSGHVRQLRGDGNVTRDAFLAADGAQMLADDFAARLRPLQAHEAWLGIAACYAAGFDVALAPGRVLTAAAGKDQLAYENEQLGRSYMVEYMVRRAMIQGQAPGSVEDAFRWAAAQIARDYPNRVPVMEDMSDGHVGLQMAPGGAVAARAASPPASGTPPPSERPAPPANDSPGPGGADPGSQSGDQPSTPPPTGSCSNLIVLERCHS